MSKWRPTKDGCLYVIPDIHGAYGLLELILKRILPLRKKDKIVFLGDYIDRHIQSSKVVDRVIELKEKYNDRVICLMGNHELMLLEGLEFINTSSEEYVETQYEMWKMNGGLQSIIGYMNDVGLRTDVMQFLQNKSRVKDIIPDEHVNFFRNLDAYYEEGNFVFVHGGCHPDQSPANFSMHDLVWDRTLCKLVLLLIDRGEELSWEKVIITGHNGGVFASKNPIIKDKFMMLDCAGQNGLLVIEAHSMEAFMAEWGNARLVKHELKETLPSPKPKSKSGFKVRRLS
jgi:serine/threonine protein phosphatase 1